MAASIDAVIDGVYRSDWGRIVATLIRLVGDFDVAEEAAQEAFAAAVDQWRLPAFPNHRALGSFKRPDIRRLTVFGVEPGSQKYSRPTRHPE